MTASTAAASAGFARRLNLGCGARLRDDWTNVDVLPAPGVLVHDLREPLPFADGSYDLVYHSHVLEHFRPADVPAFLTECRRVLRPGGLLRVAVPDLEGIARGYLEALERVDAAERDGDEPARIAADRDRRWMTLELFDQTTRETSGGRMGELLKSGNVPNEPFIRERCGLQFANWLDACPARAEMAPPAPKPKRSPLRRAAGAVRRRLRAAGKSAGSAGEMREALLSPEDREALQIGRFRLAGEVHQWMYDRVELAVALRAAGFVDPVRRGALDSGWGDWAEQCLDAEPDGTVYKPDSLFMEATAPATDGSTGDPRGGR